MAAVIFRAEGNIPTVVRPHRIPPSGGSNPPAHWSLRSIVRRRGKSPPFRATCYRCRRLCVSELHANASFPPPVSGGYFWRLVFNGGGLEISTEAKRGALVGPVVFAKKKCEVVIKSTPQAICAFNEAPGKKIGLFHVTCQRDLLAD